MQQKRSRGAPRKRCGDSIDAENRQLLEPANRRDIELRSWEANYPKSQEPIWPVLPLKKENKSLHGNNI